MSFHGSYDPADVTFLLEPIALRPIPVAERERLIQSGARHYAEVLAPEVLPSPRYLEFYDAAMARNAPRLGREIAALAVALAERGWSEVVLASLARAGTPIGVLLRRALAALGQPTVHYSLSIIRGRGIDARALDWIAARHDPARVVFVDGWTGKGAIAGQLATAMAGDPRAMNAELLVVADLAGVADLAATDDDYVMPSAILNAVISGLISRTVLDPTRLGPEDFHGCVYYADWAAHDLSRAFVDQIFAHVEAALRDAPPPPAAWSDADRARRREVAERFVLDAMAEFAVADRNWIKPGAGEATRAVLRRVPRRLLIRDLDDPETRHLVWLATEKKVTITVRPEMPYRAVTLIQRLGQ